MIDRIEQMNSEKLASLAFAMPSLVEHRSAEELHNTQRDTREAFGKGFFKNLKRRTAYFRKRLMFTNLFGASAATKRVKPVVSASAVTHCRTTHLVKKIKGRSPRTKSTSSSSSSPSGSKDGDSDPAPSKPPLIQSVSKFNPFPSLFLFASFASTSILEVAK